MTIKVLEYLDRKIIVVDGQPYYQSTGMSSSSPGTWFPFIMIMGNKNKNWDALSGIYKKDILKEVSNPDQDKQLIIKYEIDTINIPDNEKLNQNDDSFEANLYENGRIPTKTTLIISSRLSLGSGEGIYPKVLRKLGLNEKQIEEAKKPLKINERLDEKTTNPDKVNEWLINQGAQAVQLVLNNEIKNKLIKNSTMFPPDKKTKGPTINDQEARHLTRRRNL